MAFMKKLGLAAIGAGLFLAGYSLDRSQNVVIKRDWLGTTQSVCLKQAGIERTLVQDPKNPDKWSVSRNKTIDNVCDSAVSAGKWICEKAGSVYEESMQSSNAPKEYGTRPLSGYSH
jgi:hypothetical protein